MSLTDIISKILADLPRPVGVLGYGVEGKSTCRFLNEHGIDNVVVFDRQTPPEDTGQLPAGVNQQALSMSGGKLRERKSDNNIYVCGPRYLDGLSKVNTLFRSPGIRPDTADLIKFTNRGGALTSQIELFFKIWPRGDIIGVTGTLGKGTCCSILKSMLDKAGVSSVLGGNIGVPALDLITKYTPGCRAILELSSFQLSTLKVSPAIAVVLKTTSEHLDWHTTTIEYRSHKANITRHQQEGDTLIYNSDAEGSREIAQYSKAHKLPFGIQSSSSVRGDHWQWGTFGLSYNQLKIKGSYNLENMAAAAMAAHYAGADEASIINAAKSFKGLEHRLEFVCDTGGVSYYNDSYATRPEAAIGAVGSFPGQTLGLILGGSEKHADFEPLARALCSATNLKAVALIGQTAERIGKELEKSGAPSSLKVFRCQGLEDALKELRAQIAQGVILLSPACASFGLFTDYKERGKIFKALVSA